MTDLRGTSPVRTTNSRELASGQASTHAGAPLALFCIALVLAAIAMNSNELAETITFASVAMATFLLACLLAVAPGVRARTLFDLRLGSWFFGYAAVAFGAASISALVPAFVPPQVNIASIPGALFTLSIAFGLCAFGYSLRTIAAPLSLPIRSTRRTLERSSGTKPRSIPALYVTFAVGIGADFATAALTGQYGYLGDAELVTTESAAWYVQPLAIISSLRLAAIFGISLVAFSGKSTRVIPILAPALAIAVPLGLLTGMKESLVDIGLAVLLPYVLAKGRVRLAPILAFAAIFVFLITPFITQLRADVRSGAALTVGDAFQHGVDRILSPGDYLLGNDESDSALQVLSRLRQVDNFVVITDKTPDGIPFRDLSEIAVAPLTGMVPRGIWPDKPVRLAGYEFYRTYYEGLGRSSSAITPQGSFYMHGGVSVVLVGMFAIGILLRATDDALSARSNQHGALLLLFLAPDVVKQEMDVPGFLASVIVICLMWFLAAFTIFKRSRGAGDGPTWSHQSSGTLSNP
ncbi:hypothetical protein B4U78_010570 [Microbacterium esteraromaticum]|nr:hypothetical protein B4U78_010570 [Microbacterium esteraromaticum]